MRITLDRKRRDRLSRTQRSVVRPMPSLVWEATNGKTQRRQITQTGFMVPFPGVPLS